MRAPRDRAGEQLQRRLCRMRAPWAVSPWGAHRTRTGPGPWSIAHELVRNLGDAVLSLSAPRQPGYRDGGSGLTLFLPSTVTERLLWTV